MPFPLIPIVASAAALAGVAGVLKLKSNQDKAALAAECEGIRTELELSSVAGKSAAEVQALSIRLAACARRAGSAGVAIDPTITGLLPCQQQREYIDRVWTDYKATSYDDPVARDNKRNNVLSAGSEMVRCLRAQLAAATTPDQIRLVMNEITKARQQSHDRAQCMFAGTSGCGRFGLNEEHGNDRAWYELAAIAVPLGDEWNPAYTALGRGIDFRAAANLPEIFKPGDTSGVPVNPLVAGDYGGLRREGERKLAAAISAGAAARNVLGPNALQVSRGAFVANISRTLRG